MSEDDPTPPRYTPGAIELSEVREWFAAPDPQLQRLANGANMLGWGVPVTLWLPWGFATGRTAPDNFFFDDISKRIREATDESGNPPNKDQGRHNSEFDKVFAKPAAEVLKSRNDQDYEESEWEDLITRRNTITLKDAYSSMSNAPASMATNSKQYVHDYLRVRLSTVTAWAFGFARTAD
ncbi:hypothetical protein [Williamsia sp.]|uniref:hypothetical protein n=1 Tax=Williamsia sp. TaxID=1872085 RepID=UPI002F929B4F